MLRGLGFGVEGNPQTQDTITYDTLCPAPLPQTQDTVTWDTLDVLQYEVSHATWSWVWCGGEPQTQDAVTCDTLHISQNKVSDVSWLWGGGKNVSHVTVSC